MGGLSFVAPWALVALALLPGLWWLLRVMPPSPRPQSFPAIRFLLGLEDSRKTASRTPLWLVALRLVLACLVIGAVAHPLLHAAPPGAGGPLLLVVDDGWASAKLWSERQRLLDTLLAQAERGGEAVALLTTAPPEDGGAVAVSTLRPAGEARSLVQAITPHPWPVDRAAARRALAGLPKGAALRVVWLCDGVDDKAASDFGQALAGLGTLELACPPPAATAKLLMPPRLDAAELTPRVLRLPGLPAETVTVTAADAGGRTLARQSVSLALNEDAAELRLPMPVELRNRVARLEIEGEGTAGSVALLDDRWRRRPVGLVDDAGGGASSPLLDDLFYAERAMTPFAELRRAALPELLKRPLSLAVLPDEGSLPEAEQATLRKWVEGGGVLLRLAGPKLARNPDALLPVRLRGGDGRTLGGAMSWTQPMAVAPMAESGPLAGLAVPDDLRIKAQVLAEPSIDLNDKTWARLADGTPLVTGAPLGKGWLVLIHTTAGPGWSNLGLSGLFPEILQRLLGLSQGVAGLAGERPLPPTDLLDGFGRLTAPAGVAEAMPAHGPTPPLGPHHPPGLYGDAAGKRAVNLAPAIPVLKALVPPAGAGWIEWAAEAPERDLQPALLMAALVVLLCDLAAVLVLRGLIGRRLAPLVLAGLLLAPRPSVAAVDAEAAALQTRLAYVLTGEASLDETSRAGLAALSQLIGRRTTASLGEPMGVDIEHDPLMVFPLLYWPLPDQPHPLSPAARAAVNDFMRHGGLVVIDTRDGGEGGPEKLRLLTDGLDIPPLAQVTEDHVLTRSFYLLRDEPGRRSGAAVYVQDGGDAANDNVSPVVIGGNDWAGAWAEDRSGRPLFAVVPGGEGQRELAYRFGVNLVMYALTGSYKADQVHLPAIMERLKR